MGKTVVAIFECYDFAENAAFDIRNKGLRTDNISIIVKGNENTSYYHPGRAGDGTYSLKSIRKYSIMDGIITGGILGGLAGIIVGAASMFIHGLGIIAAAGPITCLFGGLILGGIIGGIIDVGIPKINSQDYDKLISYGNTFLSMMVDEDRQEQIIQILRNNGALKTEIY